MNGNGPGGCAGTEPCVWGAAWLEPHESITALRLYAQAMPAAFLHDFWDSSLQHAPGAL